MSKLGPEAAEQYIQSGPLPPRQPLQEEDEVEEEVGGGGGGGGRGRGGRGGGGRSRSSLYRDDEGDDYLPERGGRGRGGSSALQALMVAVTDERAACIEGYEEEEGGGWGGGRGRGGRGYARGRGGERGEWGASLDRRRVKRRRRGGGDGMVVEACRGQGRGGLVRRKSVRERDRERRHTHCFFLLSHTTVCVCACFFFLRVLGNVSPLSTRLLSI